MKLRTKLWSLIGAMTSMTFLPLSNGTSCSNRVIGATSQQENQFRSQSTSTTFERSCIRSSTTSPGRCQNRERRSRAGDWLTATPRLGIDEPQILVLNLPLSSASHRPLGRKNRCRAELMFRPLETAHSDGRGPAAPGGFSRTHRYASGLFRPPLCEYRRPTGDYPALRFPPPTLPVTWP